MTKLIPKNKKGNWIKGAVNPKHKGYCTPMTKSTCTPRRKAFARTMKKHHGFHKEEGGEIEMTKVGGIGPRKVIVEKHGGLILLAQSGLKTGMPVFISEAVAKYNAPEAKEQREFERVNERAKAISGRVDLSDIQPEDFLSLGMLAGSKLLPKIMGRAIPATAKKLASLGEKELVTPFEKPIIKETIKSSPPPSTELFDLNNVKKPSGAIGSQGFTTEGVKNILTHIGITPKAVVPGNPTMREIVDHLKVDIGDAKKFKDFLEKNPIEVRKLPDDTYHLEDGHHRASLAYFTGNEKIPAVIRKEGGKLSKEYIEKAREKPGGSNVGKKKFASGAPRTGPYAGPSGGAPKGSYPIGDISHGRAAIKLAHNAPNPEGIKREVYKKYPSLKKNNE